MSSDYDRLFHTPQPDEQPAVDDATTTVDRDAILRATGATSAWETRSPHTNSSDPHWPHEPTTSEASEWNPSPHTPVAGQLPPPLAPPPPISPQWPQQPLPAALAPGEWPDPAPTQELTPTPAHNEAPTYSGPAWSNLSADTSPPPTSGPANARAIDSLAHVNLRGGSPLPPQRGWRHWLYACTRINLGPSPDELYEHDLHNRIRRNTRDAYQIGVIGLKGGAGKTAISVALGSVLSRIRGDRVLAIDADPDGGNLADRCGRQSTATIADLLAAQDLDRYNDIRAYTSMNTAHLEVLSAADYSRAERQLTGSDWTDTTDVISRFYNLVIADSGSGLFQDATQALMKTVSGLVIVASATLDGARQAAITMDWLRQHGHQELLSRACIVINHVTPGKSYVDIADLIEQFQRHVPQGRVIELPWDKHIAVGAEIELDRLSSTYTRRITELAAALSDDFQR